MDAIDIAITQYLNSFVGTSVRLDRIILEVLQLNTMKMMPMVAIMVWLWFSGSQLNTRKAVFSGFAGGFIALVLTRLIQNLAPHRPRPALDESLNFSLPTGGYTND
jgi:undecaprenyl-diphosphatase